MNFSFWVSRSPSETFCLLLSEDGMETMRGGWGVPGIARVRRLPDRTLFIRDSWGLYHREVLVQSHKDRLLVFRITPNPVHRLLVRSLQETWSLRAGDGGTWVQREWQWDARLFPRALWRRVIERHNQDLLVWMEHISSPRRPLYNL